MILAHVLDAWTLPAERATSAFRNLTIVSGFAAPLFLWLAGLALVLSAERTAAALGQPPHGVAEHRAARTRDLHPRVHLPPPGVSSEPWRIADLHLPGRHPQHHGSGHRGGRAHLGARRVSRLAGGGVFCASPLSLAMLTPIVRTAAWVNRLPIWFQWHLKPAGEHTTFTLLPWAGFVFAGAAVGVFIAAARDERAARGCTPVSASSGAAIIVARVLRRLSPDDLPAVVLLDQFADLFRHPGRHSDAGVDGDVRDGGNRRRRGACHSGRWSGWDAARCSSTGSTSKSSTAMRPGRCDGIFACGRPWSPSPSSACSCTACSSSVTV